MLLAAVIVGAVAALLAVVALFVVLYPWRVSATLRAQGDEAAVSGAGGVEVAGASVSAAARWHGPAALAVHVLGRSLVRRVGTTDELIASLTAKKEEKPEAPPGLGARAGRWLVARTDLVALPGLGLRLLGRLGEPRLTASVRCGFSDPMLTGRVAGWLSAAHGVLAPLGLFEAEIDWTGRSLLDVTADLSFRLRLAPLGWELIRFVWIHVHPFARAGQPRPEAPAAALTARLRKDFFDE